MTSELIEKSDVSKEEITEIIKPYFSSDQFDDFLFNYIVNMIYIDKPENENELKILIGDYLSDRIKYPEDKKNQICKDINLKLHKFGIKGSRKAIIAERLKNPIKLSDVNVGSKNTITSLSFDPNALTFQMDKMYAQGIVQSEKKVEFKFDKRKIKEMEKFMEEKEKIRESIEEVTLNHDKDESHKIDININTFTIHIGGKTLLEDASLKIAFGRRYVLIGRNGVGKTTLLNHIMRKEIDGVPKNLQIVHVEQETIITEKPLLDEVL